jgi:DNA-binding FrmR family transcriptional regulator
MLLATMADAATATIAPLDAGDALVVWDTEGGTEEWLPHPAPALRAGRRLAVVEEFSTRHIDVACATPASFCTTSYGLARALGLRFLALEAGTPVRLVREAARALAAAAQPELAVSWLAAPAAPPVQSAAATGYPPLPDHATRAVLNRLKRVEGQSRGLQRLVEERRGYDEILPQLAAMRAALEAIGLALLSEQLAACLATADEPAGAQRVEAAKRAFLRLG